MSRRLVLTIGTAACLIGMYAVYSVVTRPFVTVPPREKPKVEARNDAIYEPPEENRRIALKYLPHAKWAKRAANSEMGLHSQDAYIFTNDWRRDDENSRRVRFTPFVMVWKLADSDGDGEAEAISIACESAQLEFASDIDEKSFTNPGRVVKATFDDNVWIWGPNDMQITGQNFFFDESSLSLSTSYPVQFQYLTHQGRATKMKMKLIPGVGAPAMDRPNIYGVEWIRMVGGPNASDPNKPGVLLVSQVPQGEKKMPVVVKCDGDLNYIVASRTAVLEHQVRAKMGVKPNVTWMDCDTLAVTFEPKKTGASVPPPNPHPAPGEYQKFETNLEFCCSVAYGARVKVRSQAYGVEAEMTQLTYVAASRFISMVSTVPGGAVVTRHGSSMKAPQIDTILTQENALASLKCIGKGEMKYADEVSHESKFAAKWEKQMRLTNDETTKLGLFELEDKAQFLQLDQETALGADLIKVWLAKMDFKLNSPSTKLEAGEAPKPAEPEPKRFLATGDVALVSPRMTIENTKELEVLFDEPAPPQTVSARSRSRSALQSAGLTQSNDSSINRSGTLSSAAQGRTGQIPKRPQLSPTGRSHISAVPSNARSKPGPMAFANIPAESDRSLGPSVDIPLELDAPRPSTRPGDVTKLEAAPISISADRIRANMQRISGVQQPEMREVHSEGNVKITQESQLGEKPLTLRGQIVDIQTASQNHEVIHVLGNPALIQDQRFSIEGKDINLDRGANRAWVRGPGEMKVPLPADANIPHDDTAAGRELQVVWNESMDFDGLKAKFFGLVRAKLGFASMFCEQMTLQLANRLSFQSETVGSQPTMKIIHCQENVKFENSVHSKGKQKILMDIYRGTVGEFELDYVTGDVKATGPGRILFWRRKENPSNELATRESIQANRPIPTEVAAWDYAKIQFQGRLNGTFDVSGGSRSTYQSVTIEDRVEVVRGPVTSLNEAVNPDKLPSMGGTMRCERLEVVNHAETKLSAKDNYFELFGRNNAEVEGQVNGERFTASADEITYNGANGLYSLRAYGKRTARVTDFSKQTGGGEPASQIGQWIQFNPDPKRNYLNISGAREGQGSR